MTDGERLRGLAARSGASHVHVGGVDHLGTWRGKRLSLDAACAAADGRGVAFSDVLFALTVAEDLVEPPAGHAGWFPVKERGFPDVFLVPDLATFRPLPWLGGEPWLLGAFAQPDGSPVPGDTREALRRVLARAAERGLRVRAAFEYEVYVLDAPVAELDAAGFADALPTAHTHPYTYHAQRIAQDRELLDALVAPLAGSGLVVEGANCETGQGQVEINLRYDDALAAADAAFLAKQAIKATAAGLGRTATFMAKPRSDWAGSSCHVHVSLWSPDGERNLLAEGPEGALCPLASQAIGGLVATMPAATALCCPTANSYRRLVPYSWAATTASWGPDNRSTGLRTIEAEHGIGRIEHRLPGADANPYLALAAVVAGILHGIDAGLEAPPATTGDAYATPGLVALPATLDRAVDALAADAALRPHLGDDLVDLLLVHLAAEAEHHRQAVSSWERRRYLELA